MQRLMIVFGLLVCLFVGGCGSGSGNSAGGGGGGGGTPPTIPTLSSIAPSSTAVGAADTNLSAYGSNFLSGATIEWNGKALATTWKSATSLIAIIPAADLAKAGSASVTVVNAYPDGAKSGSQSFTINGPVAAATWIKTVPGVTVPWDMVSDNGRKMLYVSTATEDPDHPNAIVPVDPISGTAATPIAAGTNPHLLALSSDASYLWTSLDGDHTVQRFVLPGLKKDISFPIPVNQPLGTAQTLSDLQAARVNPHTVATAVYGQNGVYVYDDAKQRPVYVPSWEPGGGPGVSWIQWGKDDSVLYGFGGMYRLPVDASGVKWDGTYRSLNTFTPPIYDPANALAYSWITASDLNRGTQAGQFDVPGPDTACTADDALNRYYCVTVYSDSGVDVYNFELWVFNLQTYALTDRYYIGSIVGSSAPQSNSPVTGSPRKLLRFGMRGWR